MSDITKDDCIISNKCIYNLIQSAHKCYKKAVDILKSSSFIGGSIDPCFYVNKSAKGIVYIALYVDNNLMVGNIATIHDVIKALKSKGLVLKIVEGLQDNFSCKIKFFDDKRHAWLGHPHQIKNLENKFGGLVNDIWSHKTPGTPKFLIIRPTEEIKKILMEDQQEY